MYCISGLFLEKAFTNFSYFCGDLQMKMDPKAFPDIIFSTKIYFQAIFERFLPPNKPAMWDHMRAAIHGITEAFLEV